MINNFLLQRKSCHRLSHGSCSPSQSSLSNMGQSPILSPIFYLLWSLLNMFSCSCSNPHGSAVVPQQTVSRRGSQTHHPAWPRRWVRLIPYAFYNTHGLMFIFSKWIFFKSSIFRVFLLRDSQSNPKTFVLSLCHAQRIRHIQIIRVSSVLTLDMFRQATHIRVSSKTCKIKMKANIMQSSERNSS